MAITSLPFGAFVAGALVVYYAFPRSWQNHWLLLVSCAFYASFGWQLVAILLLSAAGNVAIGRQLARHPARRRAWLALGITANLALLVALRSTPPSLAQTPLFQAATVVGASFYVLRGISYLLDVSTKTVEQVSPSTLALYFVYFPTLLAGPIERAGVFLPRLQADRIVDDRTIAHSLGLVLLGMSRKILIADPLAELLPGNAFVAPARLDGSALAWTIVGYAFYLYNEFAGYTAIVRGVSGLFGIPLTPNFSRPFFATSFSDFWNRWHISLSRWLRDYVYLPTSRAILRRWRGVGSVPNLLVPPMLTMLVCGAWHGSAPGIMPGMLVWGALHGVYLTVERLVWLRRPTRARPPRGALLARLVVFVLAVIALVPFRAGYPLALSYWAALARWQAWDWSFWPMSIYFAASLGIDWAQERRNQELFLVGMPRLACALVGVATLILCYLTTRGVGDVPFVYQGF